MNSIILFKITIQSLGLNTFIYYVAEDCNTPEKALEKAIRQYMVDRNTDDDKTGLWNRAIIESLEGTFVN